MIAGAAAADLTDGHADATKVHLHGLHRTPRPVSLKDCVQHVKPQS